MFRLAIAVVALALGVGAGARAESVLVLNSEEASYSLLDRATEPDQIEILLAMDRDDQDTIRYVNEVIMNRWPNNIHIYLMEPLGYANLNMYYNTLAGLAWGYRRRARLSRRMAVKSSSKASWAAEPGSPSHCRYQHDWEATKERQLAKPRPPRYDSGTNN